MLKQIGHAHHNRIKQLTAGCYVLLRSPP